MSSLFKKLVLSFGLLLMSVPFSNVAFADIVNISVSPPIIELKANPGDTLSQIIKVDVAKDKSGVTLSTKVKDFYYDEKDELQFLTPEEEEDPELKQFSLKSWLSVDKEVLFDGPSDKDIPVTIKVPKDALPGGRYGMVLFSKSANQDGGAGGASVGIGGQVGVMILVTVNGKFSSGGDLSEGLRAGRLSGDKKTFDSSRLFVGGSLFKNGPVDFKFRYQNNSATHVVPKGSITVKNIFGGLVGKFDIQGKRVFPGVSRSIYGTLDKDFLFGIYTANLEITDGDGKSHNSSTFFIGFPLKLVTIIILFIVSIFMFFKYYNRWLINKALKQYGKSSTTHKK
jgi:hypothetical protein